MDDLSCQAVGRVDFRLKVYRDSSGRGGKGGADSGKIKRCRRFHMHKKEGSALWALPRYWLTDSSAEVSQFAVTSVQRIPLE